MNILHATTFLNGGAGNVLVDLALLQAEAGHQVWVIANKSEFDGHSHYQEQINRLRDASVPFETFDSLFKRDLVLNCKAVLELRARFSRSAQFNIVHAHASVPAKICKQAFTDQHPKPFSIQTMHGWGLNKTRTMEEDDIDTMNSLNGVVVLNESGKNLLVSKGVEESLLHIIPNGISTEIPPVCDLSTEISQFLYNRRWNFRFLCVGEVGDRKNQLFLMRAIKQLNEYGVECSVVFMGPEQNEGYYDQCIIESCADEFCYWAGEVPNASSYMQHFDAIVLPSKSEGMPISIIEAFRAKVLVFGSRIPEIEELLGELRGYLFDIESTKEFVGRVTCFDRSFVPEITHNAYELYCNQFTLSTMAHAYFELYQN
jgi:glycosyltransferase involved in cell wall biosynthesis